MRSVKNGTKKRLVRIERLLIGIFLLLVMVLPCFASDIMAAQWESIDTSALEEAAKASGIKESLNASFDFHEALHNVGSKAADTLQNAVRKSVGSGGVLLLVVLFSELAGTVSETTGATSSAAGMIGVVAVTAVSVADVSSLMGLGRAAVDQIDSFSTLLIPVVTACSAASGSVTGSAARQVAVVFFSDLLIRLIDRVLIPFVYLYTGACVASAAVENQGIAELARLLKWAVTTVLTTLLLAFTGYLSLSSAAAAGADAVTIRLTRTVISNMVPVVGGILSGATETVLSGVAVLRNIVGTFGVVAVLGFCVSPFLRLGIQYLVYRVVAVLASVVSRGSVPKLINDIAGAFGLVLGMTGTAALLVMLAIFGTLAVAVG
ncbi:MAG: stage III sporulation protein AE [Oscillospiraceae bacterium]|nr:stage III sporulation protein AE [Oscillospiraceae bacterium]